MDRQLENSNWLLKNNKGELPIVYSHARRPKNTVHTYIYADDVAPS